MADNSLKIYRAGNLKITVDRSKCISCAACTAVAPNTFEMDDEFICQVKDLGSYDDKAAIKQAAAGCSGEAITVEEVKENKA